MGIKSRIESGSTVFVSGAGKSLLDTLWAELLKEWHDPDVISSKNGVEDAYDAGYCVGLAYTIAKIEEPYEDAEVRIENVIERARQLHSASTTKEG
jgi:hypothetical protein